MIDIKAGRELDQAVAEAIGLESWGHRCKNCGSLEFDAKLFHPSTDLNAAFAAAEKVGLFDTEGSNAGLGQAYAEDVTWTVSFVGSIVYKSTPALAICAAILKLKEEE